MYIKELTNTEFNLFTNSYPISSIYQTSEYGFVMHNQGYDSMFIGLVDNDHVIAASLLLIEKKSGFKYAYAPRGFILDYKDTSLVVDFTNLLRKFLSKLGVIAVKLSPMIVKSIYDAKHDIFEYNDYFEVTKNNLTKLEYHHYGFNNFFEGLKPRFEAILDIDRPYYLIFRDLKKSFKTKIRSAEARFITIYKGDSFDLENLYFQSKNKYPRDLKYFEDCYYFYKKRDMIDFYYAKLDTTNYLKYVQKELARLETLDYNLNNKVLASRKRSKNLINSKIAADNLYNDMKNNLTEAIRLLQEYPDGVILSSVLVSKYNDKVHVLIDGFDHRFKKFNSKHLLIWKLIEKFSKEGYKEFNLGGVTNPKLEDNKYQGLNDFKTGFGAKIYEYFGDLELVCNKGLYLMYQSGAPLRSILKK